MTPHNEVRLVVDGAKCDGHAICALVLAERISLDTWGFASLVDEPLVGRREIARARRAVRACPAGALTLLSDPRGSATPVALVTPVSSPRGRPSRPDRRDRQK